MIGNLRIGTPLRALWLTVFMLLPAGAAQGQGRSYGMLSAGTALTRGAESSCDNPAYLALQPSHSLSFSLLGIAGGGGNNSFSLSDYNRHNGAYLDAAAKRAILDAISGDAVVSAFGLDIRPLALSWGSWAFSLRTRALGSVHLHKRVVDLLFYGNELDVVYDFEPLRGESLLFTAATFSHGHTLPLTIRGTRRLHFGVNAHYYTGHAYGRVLQTRARALTGFSTLRASGEAQLRSARGGHGFGMDLGLALEAAPYLHVAVMAENLLSRLTWTREPEAIHADFILYATNVEQVLQDGLTLDEVVLHSDTTVAIPSFSMPLPLVLSCAASLHHERFSATLQGTIVPRSTALALERTRIACAGEYKVASFLWLRGGVGYKGDLGWASSCGWGIGGDTFRWDFGWQGLGGLFPPSWRGAGVASSFAIGW